MNKRINISWTSLVALSVSIVLQGCGGQDTSATASNIVVNSPAQIAQVSADNYDNNVNGMISAATLKRWKDDWTNQRPVGVAGKLIIFQSTIGPAAAEYIMPNGTNVFTYLSPSNEWVQTRTNGVISTQSMVPDGATMDALLVKYNIDPRNDMVVCAMGTGSTGNAMAQGRCWYALRYWGMDKTHLSLLNGGNQWINTNGMSGADFQATPSAAPNTGTASVKALMVDNTQLQATLDDMMRIMPGSDANVKSDGAFLWDARSIGQYSAGEKVERNEDMDTDTAGSQPCATAYCDPINPANYMAFFQNGSSRQGHPWGALQLQYTMLLDSTKGYSYKPKSELAAYLTGAVDANGMGFVGSNYALVGTGNAYQDGDTVYTYCETTFRAMITGVASAVILGKPTRFYDGAMVEWHSLSYMTDKNGSAILPVNSPWRSDVKSFYRPATSNTLVNARTITDAYASSANAIVNADKAYKTGEAAQSGGGGGGAPANPCGG